VNTIVEFTMPGRRDQLGRLYTAGQHRLELQSSRQSRRLDRALERSHHLWRSDSLLRHTHIVKGDLIFSSGSTGQTKWEKGGETFYGMTLTAERIERLSKGPNHGDD
jgi:single-strand DNA-binding protein